MSDLKTHNKDGTQLNVVKQAVKHEQANYYRTLLLDPERLEPTPEDIKCELQLQALSDFEPLEFQIDYGQFKKEMEPWEDKWVPYLRREGISNDREGLLLVGLEGDTPSDSLSIPEARRRTGKPLLEMDFTTPTDLFNDLTSLHKILNYWKPLGRSMLVKTNQGGWFPPHKDHPLLTRQCFRVIAFIGPNVDHESYEWHMNGKTWPIKQNQSYYVDTRKTHRTHSWANDSIHLIMNVPKTWENVIKLMAATRHY